MSSETSNDQKELLAPREQVLHMLEQGIVFDPGEENEAASYLEFRNNYFRIRSLRNGFKRTGPNRSGSFKNLRFSTLVELSDIDEEAREAFLHLTLDVEHAAKMEILRKALGHEKEPYAIVNDFLNAEKKKAIDAKAKGGSYNGINLSKLEQSRSNDPFIGGLIRRYKESGYPLWAFLEIITFGNFNYLYKFSSERFRDREMEDNFYLLQVVKTLRNACAHGNCLLNDLGIMSKRQKINRRVENTIRSLSEIDINQAFQLMNNRRVHQMVTTLYTHSSLCSPEQKDHRKRELYDLCRRLEGQTAFYYNGQNKQMMRFIGLFNAVVEKLYPQDDVYC